VQGQSTDLPSGPCSSLAASYRPMVAVDLPPMLSSASPGWMPAFSAGDPWLGDTTVCEPRLESAQARAQHHRTLACRVPSLTRTNCDTPLPASSKPTSRPTPVMDPAVPPINASYLRSAPSHHRHTCSLSCAAVGHPTRSTPPYAAPRAGGALGRLQETCERIVQRR